MKPITYYTIGLLMLGFSIPAIVTHRPDAVYDVVVGAVCMMAYRILSMQERAK